MSSALKELAKKHGIYSYKDAADLRAKIAEKKKKEQDELEAAIKAEEDAAARKAPAPLPPPRSTASVVSTSNKDAAQGSPVQVFVNAAGEGRKPEWLSVANQVWNTVVTMIVGAALYAAWQTGTLTLIAKAGAL